MSELEILVFEEGEISILVPRGELKEKAAAKLEALLESLLDEGRRHFVLDLAETEHVGSAGLRVFLMLHRKLVSHRGAVALAGLNTQVREAFELAGFTRLFALRKTRGEAIGALPVSSRPARVAALAREILVPGSASIGADGYRDLAVEAKTSLARKIINPQEAGRPRATSEPDPEEGGKEGLLGKVFGWGKKR